MVASGGLAVRYFAYAIGKAKRMPLGVIKVLVHLDDSSATLTALYITYQKASKKSFLSLFYHLVLKLPWLVTISDSCRGAFRFRLCWLRLHQGLGRSLGACLCCHV